MKRMINTDFLVLNSLAFYISYVMKLIEKVFDKLSL